MDDDWDLQAVVRSCSASTATSSSAPAAVNTNSTTGCVQATAPFQQDYMFSTTTDVTHFSQDLFEGKTGNSVEELHDLFKPFYPKPLPISPLSVLGGLQDLSYDQNQQQQVVKQQQLPQQQQTQIKPRQQAFTVVHGSTTPKVHNPNPRSKRRKNNMKRVCHVAAENLSSDMWSWRKYGQKPIKGSPYPRGYYRCSTSKGCMARKQVERNRSDPGMFIVTYTAEHNHPMPTHRNSLAGSTRNKQAEVAAVDDPNKPSCSAEMSPAASHSPALEKMESSRDDLAEAEDEDDDFIVSNMALDDDFFTGLEDFTGGECLSDSFRTSSPLPWIGTTTAG